ncbi:hypothetical protein NE865_05491 [Phthorimaea operculella]|nr:hypothetical protein NE865_05491 [Phthorimaea operculella]
MNSDKDSKTGGASIKPSARPSIRGYRERVYSGGERENMVRYALEDNDDERERKGQSSSQSNASKDLGRDEVDNVQSKFARAPSPLVARRITRKRNSFDDGPTYTDDSELSRLFSPKSLPARLESPISLSSDDFGNWSTSTNRSPNTSQNRRTHGNDTSVGSNFESIRGTPSRSHISVHNQSTNPEPKSNQPAVLLMGLLGVLAAGIVAFQNGSLPTSLPEVFTVADTYNTAKFYDDLNSLGGKYKITDDTILQLKQAISTIFKRQDTGSFVLAYKSTDVDFDHEKFNTLVNTIAATSAKYLRNDSTSVQHIVVDGSKLTMRSHSELINQYRDDVTRGGVMLVRELHEVPSSLAMAFHYYCDEYNPLVKRSAIFFTLDMAKCEPDPAEQHPTYARIEKCLKRKWKDVPKDNITPLLNRVVSIVVNIGGA